MSNGDDAASFLYLLGVLAMVGSAFAVRRVPIGQTAKMAAAWLLIFGALFAAFTLREDFKALGERIWSGNESQVAGSGGELRLRRLDDGHFWVNAELNGSPVRFLIDSGATTTTISAETAARARVEPSGLPVIVSTANGVVTSRRARADRLEVGSIERSDFPVHVSETLGDTDLLGMNFLSSLSGWRVEGNELILRP